MQRPTPFYAYILALIGGVFGMVALVDAPVFALFLAFGALGGVFGAVWPRTAWRWGLWTAAPLVLTMLSSVAFAGAPRAVDLLVIVGVPLFAGAGAAGGVMLNARRRPLGA